VNLRRIKMMYAQRRKCLPRDRL